MGGGVGGGVSTNHKSSNRIELSQIGQNWLNFQSFDPTPPIDPPIHLHTHPWLGVSLQIINLQTKLNYLDSVNILKMFSVLTWPHPSTHQPIHPPTKLYTHPWMGKSLQIANLQTELKYLVSSSAIEFWLISGVPPWEDGGEECWEGAPDTCAHACTCMHVCVHMTSSGIPRDSPNGGCHLHEILMFTMHACACACMCAHVCACVWGAPHNHPIPIHPPPPSELQGAQNTKIHQKHQMSWTNRDNSILFEDSLPVIIPELI